jgi:hypothetical protein
LGFVLERARKGHGLEDAVISGALSWVFNMKFAAFTRKN